MKTNNLFLGLGTNLGERENQLSIARTLIEQKVGKISATSKVFETSAWGIVEQNSFLNQVLQVDTSFSPLATLHLILQIEKEMGRIRRQKWGERVIDIDILYYNDEIIKTERLEIPHPFIQDRKFVLVPMGEIAPEKIHPIFGLSTWELLENCKDEGQIKEY